MLFSDCFDLLGVAVLIDIVCLLFKVLFTGGGGWLILGLGGDFNSVDLFTLV